MKDHLITGRPPKLSDSQVEELKEHLKGKNWELKEIKELIFNLFNIEIGITAVYNLLRNKIEMHMQSLIKRIIEDQKMRKKYLKMNCRKNLSF